VRVPPGIPILVAYKLTLRELSGIVDLWSHVLITDFADGDRMEGIEAPPIWNQLLKDAHVSIRMNPVEFLVLLARANTAVNWRSTPIYYTSGSVQTSHNLQLVQYEREGFQLRFFHFSNPDVTRALASTTELLAKFGTPHAVVNKTSQPLSDEGAQQIAWLIDHPILSSWYLIGQDLRLIDLLIEYQR
jgi:hypothetical protein